MTNEHGKNLTLREALNYVFDKWRGLAFISAIAAGFGVSIITPGVKISALEAQVVELRAQVIPLQRYVTALAIGQCLDRPARETQLMRLSCDKLLRGGDLDITTFQNPRNLP